jgi:hypothetical protein
MHIWTDLGFLSHYRKDSARFFKKKETPVDPDGHTCVYLSKILAVVVGDSKKTTMPPSLDKLYNTIST